MLVRDGRIQALGRHVERLTHSSAALTPWRLPRDLRSGCAAAAAELTGEQRLRVDVVPGEEIAIATAAGRSRHAPPGDARALRRPRRPGPPQVARPPPAAASRYRGTIRARTPLLVDSDGTVLEGAWGNLWLLDGDTLITPPADGRILPGVTRALLLELAPALGYHAREQPIALDRARRAPVSFMTSAIRLAVPATLSGGAASPSAPVDRIRTALAAHF